MEYLTICLCLCMFLGNLAFWLLAALWLWKQFRRPAQPEESPQEAELRRAQTLAQKRFEQGFQNLMQYDGRPGREKEGDGL